MTVIDTDKLTVKELVVANPSADRITVRGLDYRQVWSQVMPKGTLQFFRSDKGTCIVRLYIDGMSPVVVFINKSGRAFVPFHQVSYWGSSACLEFFECLLTTCNISSALVVYLGKVYKLPGQGLMQSGKACISVRDSVKGSAYHWIV
jgi:hypothetical protein